MISISMDLFFSTLHIESIFDINRKVLFYWRKIGLFIPSIKSEGGHHRYSFSDLVALKTIKSLKDAGISTFRMKQVVRKLKTEYPESANPLAEKSLYVLGRGVIVVDKVMPYNVLTGQGTLLDNKTIKASVKELTLHKFSIPLDGEGLADVRAKVS